MLVREAQPDKDGNIVPAEIVGFDPFSDVGLLKVDPGGVDLQPLELADSDKVVARQYGVLKTYMGVMEMARRDTFLIDPEGREVGRLVGPAEWHSADAKNLIKAAIAAD